MLQVAPASPGVPSQTTPESTSQAGPSVQHGSPSLPHMSSIGGSTGPAPLAAARHCGCGALQMVTYTSAKFGSHGCRQCSQREDSGAHQADLLGSMYSVTWLPVSSLQRADRLTEHQNSLHQRCSVTLPPVSSLQRADRLTQHQYSLHQRCSVTLPPSSAHCCQLKPPPSQQRV